MHRNCQCPPCKVTRETFKHWSQIWYGPDPTERDRFMEIYNVLSH